MSDVTISELRTTAKDLELLKKIRDAAREEGDWVPNLMWRHAYMELAAAADRLILMIGRTEEKDDD